MLILLRLVIQSKKLTITQRYINTQINKLMSDNFTVRIKQANLARKHDIISFLKKKDFYVNKKLFQMKKNM